MDPNNQQKAEHLLASDQPYNWEKLSLSEQEFANQITTIIRCSGNETLSDDSKNLIWENVRNNISPSQDRVLFPSWTKIAACVILIASIALWCYREYRDPMAALANSGSSVNASAECSLILSNGDVILLPENTSVTYDRGKIQQQRSSLIVTGEIYQEKGALNKIKVPYGRRAQITLDDGTKVWMNSGSQLVYPVTFGEENREVFLVGEAYFDVVHKESPFYVSTEKSKVKVLGTQFNISSYPDDSYISTTLVTGSIELTIPNSGWIRNVKKVLKPGDQASYSKKDKTVEVKTVQTGNYASWKYGYLQLDHMSFDAILKRLSRYYNIQISRDASVSINDTFSGRLDLKENLEDVMKILCAGTNFTYNENERRLISR